MTSTICLIGEPLPEDEAGNNPPRSPPELDVAPPPHAARIPAIAHTHGAGASFFNIELSLEKTSALRAIPYRLDGLMVFRGESAIANTSSRSAGTDGATG